MVNFRRRLDQWTPAELQSAAWLSFNATISTAERKMMKNENYGLTDQQYGDLAPLRHLPSGCELRRNLRQAEKKLRKIEKKLRFSVQTEKIWPLPITYNEKNENLKTAEKAGVAPKKFCGWRERLADGTAKILAPFPKINFRNHSTSSALATAQDTFGPPDGASRALASFQIPRSPPVSGSILPSPLQD